MNHSVWVTTIDKDDNRTVHHRMGTEFSSTHEALLSALKVLKLITLEFGIDQPMLSVANDEMTIMGTSMEGILVTCNDTKWGCFVPGAELDGAAQHVYDIEEGRVYVMREIPEA